MRFRTDHRWIAEYKALGKSYDTYKRVFDDLLWDTTPAAQPGDTWVCRHYETNSVAGYTINCPKCKQNHHWTTAVNCGSRRKIVVKCEDGKEYEGYECDHSKDGSCWNWTGSAEEGTLSASPSLYCVESLGGCGWHGFLTNGNLVGA